MSHGWYLNPEHVFEKSVELNIKKMRTSNIESHDSILLPDSDSLFINLQYGLTALFMLCAFLECCVNTIIREVYSKDYNTLERSGLKSYEEKVSPILRANIDEKLKALYRDGKISQNIRGLASWRDCKKLLEVRNEFIHFKIPYMQESSIPDFDSWFLPGSFGRGYGDDSDLEKESLIIGELFTQEGLTIAQQEINSFINQLADEAGLIRTPGSSLVTSDGRDWFTSFFCDKDDFLSQYPNGQRD